MLSIPGAMITESAFSAHRPRDISPATRNHSRPGASPHTRLYTLNNMANRQLATRRDFLAKTSLAAAAVKTIRPTVTARSAARVIGANDRINVGSIGVGGMGTVHLRTFVKQSEEQKDLQVVAVSDVYTVRKEAARSIAHLAEKDVHHDYRDLLTRSDVDAVVIATPEHWHGQMALDALAAGKDVYLQKPMTSTIEEARLVTEAVKKYNRVLQVGSQGLSSAATHKARELIEQGEIGTVLWGQGSSARNSTLGEWNWKVESEGTPETIDWNRWLGSAPRRPFSAERYFRWRKYWDYSGGIATDLYYHILGPLLFGMGAQFPTYVTGSGGIYVQKDREVPDTYATQIEYPNYFITLAGSMANSAGDKFHPLVIYGHEGTISFGGSSVTVSKEVMTPDSLQSKPPAPPPKVYEVNIPPDVHRTHTDNFFSCMRSRKLPNLHAELGYQMTVAIQLGVEAYREGRGKVFDPATQRVVERHPARPAWEGDGKNHDA